MKNKITIVFFLFTSLISSQTRLTIDECYSKARENHPLIKQKDYLAKSKDYSISNIWKGYYPQVTLSGQATYQSDVISIPISLPGINIAKLSKDQYKAVAEVNQIIYDGGIMATQAEMQKASTAVDNQKVETELTKLKERVNQIYFGILLLDKQLIQTEIIEKDINTGLEKLNAALINGTATHSSADVLKAELLKTIQKKIELKSSRHSYIEMLGLLISQPLDKTVLLEQPNYNFNTDVQEINRPELKLFRSQENLIDEQRGLSLAKILPKASLFFQGGYGKPALNMLKNSFDWYYIAGARLSWSISNLYTYQNENEILELNKKSVEAQKETFLLNTNLLLKQQTREIEKLKELIEVDKQIIEIRATVTEAAKSQLENGVITSNDFIRELNAEDQARQNLSIHTIQLLFAQQTYKLTLGN
ncbi:MAG: TolC family protein [Melioribacteraceae bacterium]|nr:TolC family protein [Melioribacteraceae bacterium]